MLNYIFFSSAIIKHYITIFIKSYEMVFSSIKSYLNIFNGVLRLQTCLFLSKKYLLSFQSSSKCSYDNHYGKWTLSLSNNSFNKINIFKIHSRIYYSIFFTNSSPLSVNLYNLPFLASGLMHSTSACAFNSDRTFEIWFVLIPESLAI